MGAPDLHDCSLAAGELGERALELAELVTERREQLQRHQTDGGGRDVVRRLGEVDVVVGVDRRVTAASGTVPAATRSAALTMARAHPRGRRPSRAFARAAAALTRA